MRLACPRSIASSHRPAGHGRHATPRAAWPSGAALRGAALATCACVLGAPGAQAAESTALTLAAPDPAEARYSQALAFAARLTRGSDGAGVAGAACSPVCSLVIRVERVESAESTDEPAQSFTLNAQGIPVDADGAVAFRVPFVDGAFDDARFTASTTGTRYRVRARFAGTGTGALDAATCDDAVHPEGDLCAAEASVEVALLAETASVLLGAGRAGALGDTITLSAALTDPNGNAPPDGTLTDGEGPVDLVNRAVDFFYDQNNNGDPEAFERVGTATTNASGVAALAFTLDPQFVRAGTYAQGIHVRFGGDGQYGVAGAAGELVVAPAALDVSRSLIEADARELPADGGSRTTIRVRLVDAFNNPLDESSAPHDVTIATDLGRLVDEVRRDPESGTYTRTFQASTVPGTATITTTIDGESGPFLTITLVGDAGGCQCSGAQDAPAAAALVGALAALRRRHHRRRRHAGGGAA